MIVKVHLEKLASSVIAYISNESRELLSEAHITPEIQKRMGSREIAFFEASIADGKVVLEKEVNDPNW